jgi:hypothetical protein
MQTNDTRSVSFGQLTASLISLAIVFLFLSGATVPKLVNDSLIVGNFIDSGRYAVTQPALESISNEDGEAIVVIGSSILQYATDGVCIGERLNREGAKVYNLAIGGANPYTEMLQIPALVEAKPSTVIVDVGPNSLWNFHESESLDEYIQFRFTILSITLGLNGNLDWYSLIRERDTPYIATSLAERIQLTASYSQTAFDNVLLAEFHDEFGLSYYDRDMPGVDKEGWFEYLQHPGWLPPKFETMNQTEVEAWFEENMPKRVKYGVYNPLPNGTLNHAALDYTIRTLTEAGVEVLMVAPPHHPMVYPYLEPGQIDGHNATLAYFESTYGAKPVNWFWESWDQGMFRDRNHLGDDGRVYFCERMADVLNVP